ncbi:MAG: peptidoglycan-binding domain-containing protein [Desulfopila sp.]
MQIDYPLSITEEEEVRRLAIPSATIHWDGPFHFSAVTKKTGGGLYVIVKDERTPIYVGETMRYASRFATRLLTLQQTACDLSRRAVYLGSIVLPAGGANSSGLRKDLESALIRSYLRKGHRLTNRSSIRSFLTGARDAFITNKGSRPPALDSRIVLLRNRTYELESAPPRQGTMGFAIGYPDDLEGEGMGPGRPKRHNPAPRGRRLLPSRSRRLRRHSPVAPPRRRIATTHHNRPRRDFPTRRPTSCPCPAPATEYVRWLQSSLNLLLARRLPIDGIMSPAVRAAIKDFQRRRGLPGDGIAGPETRQALIRARAMSRRTTDEKPGL